MFLWKSTFCIFFFHLASTQWSNYSFPKDFIFGITTSAYQIEGAWSEGGKGLSIWDYDLHQNSSLVVDKTNGDIACNSYHRWKEDVELLKHLGVNFYRFSISWTRILPLGGKDTKINDEGVKYYNELIDNLLAEEILPYITIYHWDLPQVLQDKGGWLNETLIEDYVFYARTLFQLFGDRVKHWITFNEFFQFCEVGYSDGQRAPFVSSPGVGGYQCSHNALLAHGRAYRMYEKEFKSIQGGNVGVTVDGSWCDPLTPTSESDQGAAEQFTQFNYGWFTYPILLGNYPPIMIDRIYVLSKQQGYESSRLPAFTSEEIKMIKGSYDFLGLNYYSTYLCTFSDNFSQPSFESDCGVLSSQPESWEVFYI
ncbi:hypothetical protein HHI36_001067 [Cryptolaemus montrouzieri]|uniref:Uncharacterized protein n=1 Tax=Cryptolaemus montrouzieri TaxID=559131 RepID=A0ABD2P794_9CUCU